MDSPLFTLFIALLFGFCAFMVEAQQNANRPQPEFSPPPRPPHPESPPPPFTPPPPSLSPPPFSQPPPPRLRSSPPPHSLSPPPPRKPHRRSNHNLHKKMSPPPKKEKLNKGKIIGLMFIGVAAILQVCIVAFLLIRRGQLLKADNGY